MPLTFTTHGAPLKKVILDITFMLLITALQGEKPLTTGQPLAEQSRAVAAELCVHNTILISLLVASKGLVNLGTD